MAWWLVAVPRSFVRPGRPRPGPLPLLLGVLGERGFPFLPSRPPLGSRFRGMGSSGGSGLGSLSFCEGVLRFLRGAWAVHERPLRGAFLFLVGVVVVWRIGLGESVWPLVPCIPRSHRFACSRPLTLKRRRRAGCRPALVGGPLCPSDISPRERGKPWCFASFGRFPLGFSTFWRGNPAARPHLWVTAPVSQYGPGFAGMRWRCVVVFGWVRLSANGRTGRFSLSWLYPGR